ncbi:MAG: DUF6134 family protein [Bacteroidia bacterium]
MAFLIKPAAGQDKPQVFTYTILKGGESIGKYKTQRTVEGSKVTVVYQSDINLHLIFSIRIVEQVINVYSNNKLLISKQSRYINGKEKVCNSAYLKDNGYLLKQLNGEISNFSGYITHTIADLFLNEPDDYTTVYSENHQLQLTVTNMGLHKYMLQFPNGNINYYTYKNGIATQMEAHTAWKTVVFVLDQPLAEK